MSYIGQTLGQGKASRSNFTASGGETAVTVENGYQVGQLSVYLNGVKLVDTADFGATNGTTIAGLSPALVAGDIIEFVALDTFSISSQDAAIDLKAPLASPVLVTPNLGTPSAGVMTNTTGIPAAQVSGVLPVGVTGGSGLTALGTVASGNLSNTAIVYPVGHVLQVRTKHVDHDNHVTLGSNGTAVALTILGGIHMHDITPLESTSTLVISATIHPYGSGGDVVYGYDIWDTRTSAWLGNDAWGSSGLGTANGYGAAGQSVHAVTSAGTTATRTYKVGMTKGSVGLMYEHNAGSFTMTIWEIKA